jgi:hypothetical protein
MWFIAVFKDIVQADGRRPAPAFAGWESGGDDE